MTKAIVSLGLALALLAAMPFEFRAARAQTPADLSPRTANLVKGDALEDVDKKLAISKREVSRRSHQPSEEFKLPPPNLRPPPPLTLDVAPVPLPDPRPRVLFNKDFPSLKFEREEEYGFKFSERGG
ncbi:MAG: hypothetical protein JO021_15170 [Alphaproteobacteria bacterium]|nr:hypothetical protein [Alphaproteobacteria bacterium]